eukprot:6544130-Pyramimonas_sp.AAC.1
MSQDGLGSGPSSFEVGQPAPGSIRGLFLGWPFGREADAGSLADPTPRRLKRKTICIANLFCGQRRQGDIQAAAEISIETIVPNVELRVLSIDIIIGKEAGDIGKPATISLWSGHIRAGRVAAAGKGFCVKLSRQHVGRTEVPLRYVPGLLHGA